MAKFAILRLKKHHQRGTVAAAAAHLTRERECLNADPAKSGENRVWAGEKSVARVVQQWQKRLETVDRKIRGNAVTCIEYVMTYSPEALDKQGKDGYFKSAIDWLAKRHGKENILTVIEHGDEKTPHLHALVVPIRKKVTAKGKAVNALCAKDLCHGRAVLSAMQDDFYLHAGRPAGLDRGKKGSKAHHQTMRGYYANFNHVANYDELPILNVPEKGFFESGKKYQARADEAIQKQGIGYLIALNERRFLRDQKNGKKLADAEALIEAERKRTADALKMAEDAKRQAQMQIVSATEVQRKLEANLAKAEAAYREAQAKREAHVDFIVKATPEQFTERQAKWRAEIEAENRQKRSQGYGYGD